MNTTVNLDEYFSQDDLAVNNDVAFARWINPQKGNPVGLGIDITEATKAGFTPTKEDGWELKKIKLGKEKEIVECYVSQTPRIIFLNAVNTIAKNIKENAKPYYEYLKYKNGAEIQSKYSPILFLIVSNDNRIISNPIVLRPKKGCIVQFSKNIVPEWCKSVVSFYEKLGKTFGAEKPTCSFYARHIFDGTFLISDLSNKDGDSSEAWICTGFKPVELKNIFTLNTEEAKVINGHVLNLPNLLATVKGKSEEVEEPVEEKPVINLDDYTDPETGEVNLPDELMPF